MGGCGTKLAEEDKIIYQKNKEIETELQKNAESEGSKIKLLLLGAGESGKSTIFKQMKVIYGKTYTEDDRRQFRSIIYSNILSTMKMLCKQLEVMDLLCKMHVEDEYNLVISCDETLGLDLTLGNAVKTLWEDPSIQEVWRRRNEFHVIESMQYYFNRIDIIKLPSYVPDKDDILYSRVRTSGIMIESYEINGEIFEIYDVGGQRNERKKWIHCFEDVTGVIFVAAISEYDQGLYEDHSVNRMVSLDRMTLNSLSSLSLSFSPLSVSGRST
jgi:GTPase SAR1 family protein